MNIVKCGQMESSKRQGDTDFPQAYFFIRYMCDRENCWGTLAPLPPKDDGTTSNIMECNVCGNLKDDQMTDASGVEDEHPMDDWALLPAFVSIVVF